MFFTLLPNEEKANINCKSLLKYNRKYQLKDILPYALKLVGTPYLWGGKSSFGYDCSGLVQVLYTLSGNKFPRDCSMQIKSPLLTKVCKDDIQNGDLVYFSKDDSVNHVGIFIDKSTFLHSSGCVMINSIDENDMNFNSKLHSMIYGFYSLK